MNTGFLGPAVATVLTVYGIETNFQLSHEDKLVRKLQQYLPFTVLKQTYNRHSLANILVRLQQYLPFTVLKLFKELTVLFKRNRKLQQYLPFTVLKLHLYFILVISFFSMVATVLTVYGIETLCL